MERPRGGEEFGHKDRVVLHQHSERGFWLRNRPKGELKRRVPVPAEMAAARLVADVVAQDRKGRAEAATAAAAGVAAVAHVAVCQESGTGSSAACCRLDCAAAVLAVENERNLHAGIARDGGSEHRGGEGALEDLEAVVEDDEDVNWKRRWLPR